MGIEEEVFLKGIELRQCHMKVGKFWVGLELGLMGVPTCTDSRWCFLSRIISSGDSSTGGGTSSSSLSLLTSEERPLLPDATSSSSSSSSRWWKGLTSKLR